MGDTAISYQHLSDRELKVHVEHYGTENERELLKRFLEPNWDKCPNCDDKEREMLHRDEVIEEAISMLDALTG